MTPLDSQTLPSSNSLEAGIELTSSIRVQQWDWNLRQRLALGLADPLSRDFMG